MLRLEALAKFLRLVDPYLPDGELVAAHTLVERAGTRLALSRDHTVVALAGSTGSGKSSLFNALARLKLSPVGVRRPTTGVAHACVWGPLEPANRLLDWVGVLPRQRFIRESALDGDDEAALRGLVLLDLPDFDSVERSHRLEVDRLLGLVDQIVWVVDPQKYGDRILHQAYLSQFQLARRRHDRGAQPGRPAVRRRHRDRSSPTCNGCSRRTAWPARRCWPPRPSSPACCSELRAALETDGRRAAGRAAPPRRRPGDGERAAHRHDRAAGRGGRGRPGDGTPALRRARRLGRGAARSPTRSRRPTAIGPPASTGWPLVRGLRRLRPDPLRRLHLGEQAGDRRGVDRHRAAYLAAGGRRRAASAVGLSVRAVAARAAAPLPAVWAPALTNAARSRVGRPAGRARPGGRQDRARA